MPQIRSRRARAIAVALVTAASFFLAQCGSDSSTPTSATPTVTGVTGSVSTTALFKKGASAQMTVMGTMSSGGTKDVTAQCTGWASDNTAVATVSATGMITAVGSGTTTITATYSGTPLRTPLTLTVATKAAPTVTVTSMNMGWSIYAPYQPQVVFKLVYAETSKAFGYNVNWGNFQVTSSSGATLSAPNFGSDMFANGASASWKAGDPYVWPAWGTNHIDPSGTKYACYVSGSFTMPSSATVTWATQSTDDMGIVTNFNGSASVTPTTNSYACDDTHGIAPNRFAFPMPSLSGR